MSMKPIANASPDQRRSLLDSLDERSPGGKIIKRTEDQRWTSTFPNGVGFVTKSLAKAKELADRGGHSAGGQKYESRDPMSSQRRGAQKEE